jgi:transcriptional regulator with XRE-family HTH domain
LLREARMHRGVTQRSLARRAGTTQSAISRIERDHVSPSVETLRSLLNVLGEDLELTANGRDAGVDRGLVRANLSLTPEERVMRGLGFSEFVSRNRGASRRAA